MMTWGTNYLASSVETFLLLVMHPNKQTTFPMDSHAIDLIDKLSLGWKRTNLTRQRAAAGNSKKKNCCWKETCSHECHKTNDLFLRLGSNGGISIHEKYGSLGHTFGTVNLLPHYKQVWLYMEIFFFFHWIRITVEVWRLLYKYNPLPANLSLRSTVILK